MSDVATAQTPAPPSNRRLSTDNSPKSVHGARRRYSQQERLATGSIAAAAALFAGFASAAPTGHPTIDAVERAVFAAALTLVTTRARRWSWLLLASTGGLATGIGLVAGLGSVATSVAAAVSRDRSRLLGALTGGLAANAILRARPVWFFGFNTLLFGGVITLVALSAYRNSRRGTRRAVRRWGLVFCLAIAAGSALAGIAAITSGPMIRSAADNALDGVDAASDGDPDTARDLLDRAASEFGTVEDRTAAVWLAPVRAIPVVGQHLTAVHDLSAAGADLATTAAAAADVNVDDFRSADGSFNIDLLKSSAPSLRGASDALNAALDSAIAANSPWLVPPLRDPVEDLIADLQEKAPAGTNVADAAEFLPALLGGDGERTYFAMFVTPSESREIGGHMGNWAEIRADNGSLDSTEGRTITLDPLRASRRILQDKNLFPESYLQYSPDIFPQNLGATPDLGTVARAAASLYPQSGGKPIDGVAVIDPYGIEGLIALTGPITVPNGPTLTAENAAQFLLLDEYGYFPTDTERVDYLDAVVEQMVDKLSHGSTVAPRKLVDTLKPLVRQHRIRFTTFEPLEVGFLQRVGLSTTAVAPPAGDVVELLNSNVGPNKIDAFLHRRLEYSLVINSETGQLAGTATATLTNESGPDGAAYVVNNLDGAPPGTNITNAILYTPHQLLETKIDGQRAGGAAQQEFGQFRLSTQLKIPPKGTSSVEWTLVGQVSNPSTYSLLVRRHPSVHPDDVIVSVTDQNGRPYTLSTSTGSKVADIGSVGGYRMTLDEDTRLTFTLAP